MASTVNMSTSDFLARLELDGRARARPQRHGYWTLALGAALGVSAWFLLHNQGGARSAFAHALPAPVEAKAGASAVPDEVPRRAIAAPELPAAATAAALQATGYVVARRAATVSARTTAAVQAVYVDDGSYVRAGAAMAQLDDRVKRAQYELATAQLKAANARVVEVDAQIQAAQQRLERLTALTARRMASQASLDDETANLRGQRARRATMAQLAESAARHQQVQRLELEDYVIRAPFDGVVTHRTAQQGEIVSPISAGGGFTRTGIATLVDMASLEVEVDITESYISRVAPRQPVRIVLNAYPERSYQGRVIAVIPTADRNKATIRVRIALTDTDSRVLPEMGVRVDFTDP